MNAKFSVFVIKAETIIYLLSHNLHDCTCVHDCTSTCSWLSKSKSLQNYISCYKARYNPAILFVEAIKQQNYSISKLKQR